MTDNSKNTTIPTALVCDPWATPADVRVYAALDSTAHEPYPGTPKISHVTVLEVVSLIGMSEPNVRRIVARLADAGWIGRERAGRNAITTLNPSGR